MLVDITRDGEVIPAVVQLTKMGFVFVLHRETGEPLFDIEERPVSTDGVPGELLSPTQPFPVKPPPLIEQLKPGGRLVIPVDQDSFGQDLVLFRSESGEVALLDAFCPHLGAHLGHGGKVRGEEIDCPFHAWRFGTDGQCKAVPYASRMPRRASVATWHTRIVGDMILAWHHPDRLEPAWEPMAEVPEHDNDEWTDWVRKEWTIKAINQELSAAATEPG